MTNPKDDEALAKAIEEHTIRIDDPPSPAPPAGREPDAAQPPNADSGLARNVDDFQIDVPPPEGIG